MTSRAGGRASASPCAASSCSSLFAAVGKRAFNLQVREAERLRAMAEEQYLREVELPPRRGRILDRNGAELASTADVDSIYCNPRRLPDPADAARRLAHVLGMDRRELEKKLEQRRFFAWVKRKVTPDEAAAVKALALPGVAFVREPRRFYPNRSLAATVMGLAGSDGRGLDGVELALDKQLSRTTSSVVGIRDALGRDLAVDGMADAPTGAGSDVVLTIDRYLTFVTERAHRRRCRRARTPRTSSRSSWTRARASCWRWRRCRRSTPTIRSRGEAGARNRAITDTYEPGSTMKTFTIASALDAGVVRADDRFDCLQGKMMVGKYSIHDTHAHGVLTVAEVFKFSSNIGATKIARRLGRDALRRRARALRVRAPDGHRAAGRARGRRAAGRQVGRHRVRQHLVRAGARGDAAADDRGRERHRRAAASTARRASSRASSQPDGTIDTPRRWRPTTG